MGRKGEEPN
jgi:hypothetical protein